MSEELREQLSALMDGELPADQTRFLLRRVDSNVQLAQTWSCYQVVGSVMRRETLAVALRSDFSEVVMRSIAEQSPRSGATGGLRVLRWVGGSAIAATVAVLALVVVRPTQLAPPQAMQTVAIIPAAAAVSPPIDLRAPVRPSPMLMNSEFAQPASYDAELVPLPRYGLYGPDAMSRYSPYLLNPISPRAQALPNASAQPQAAKHY
ncbi:MAG: sigma-E factor negative regulatory protein [Rudaea sp.]